MPDVSMPTITLNKAAKPKSLMVVLKVSPSSLARFPPDGMMPRKTAKARLSITISTPTPDDTPKPAVSLDDGTTEAATPASESTMKLDDNDTLAPPQTNGLKRKATSANGPAVAKREKLDDNGNAKQRGKPGPKRRKGAADGEGPAPAPKLGPKANQGAINAQLRALDRSGKASRRWQRAPFTFTSFTGHKWELPQWNTAKLENGDAHSENTGSSENNAKGDLPSSAVQSIDGQGGTPAGTDMHEVPSSPPDVPMEEAAVAAA